MDDGRDGNDDGDSNYSCDDPEQSLNRGLISGDKHGEVCVPIQNVESGACESDHSQVFESGKSAEGMWQMSSETENCRVAGIFVGTDEGNTVPQFG